MIRFVLGLVTLAACTRSEPPAPSPPVAVEPAPAVKLAPPPVIKPAPTPVPVPATKITVDLTAVTLADDCGGTPPTAPQPHRRDSRARGAAAVRRCEQTSMQLSVRAAADSEPTKIAIKKVELFDDTGKSLGELAARSPTWWATKGVYEKWDQKVAAGANLSVSYVLAQPKWDHVKNRWNRTFTLKVTVAIGGADQSLQKDVHLKSPPTSLPPNVRT